MEENKDLKPSKEEKNLVLIVENANTELKRIITDSMMYSWNKNVAKAKVERLIKDTIKMLRDMEASENLIQSTELGLKQTFLREWRETITLLKTYAKKDKTGILALTIARMNSDNVNVQVQDSGGLMVDIIGDNDLAIANGNVTNIRDFMTEVENASANRFVDYADMVEDAVVDITEKIAEGSLSQYDKLGRQKSIRNMAEIETRYNLIVDDIKRQGLEKDKDFVVASSHPNESERCHFWSAKIYLLDLDVASRPMGQYNPKNKPTPKIIGHLPNGEPYYSLQQACENGFLSYNCQHRLVKYYEGINPPRYDLVTVNKERDLTTRQRILENRIRKYKARAEMSQQGFSKKYKDPFTDEYKKMSQRTYNQKMSKYWMEEYRKLAIENNLPIYLWRTRISLTEREMRNL